MHVQYLYMQFNIVTADLTQETLNHTSYRRASCVWCFQESVKCNNTDVQLVPVPVLYCTNYRFEYCLKSTGYSRSCLLVEITEIAEYRYMFPGWYSIT